MRLTLWSEKENTLYINTNAIMPDTSRMNFREHCKAYDEAFAMTYIERIYKFAKGDNKRMILEEVEKHKGCKFSEFIDA